MVTDYPWPSQVSQYEGVQSEFLLEGGRDGGWGGGNSERWLKWGGEGGSY